ncbi:hypothetical protein [Saccharibacillus sacchari]|uniref:Uncharacterized protein n=1 Tax=Saccharibacillus sacchari TaxID=456493 RepID=A0ACC6PHQ2_9BACL
MSKFKVLPFLLIILTFALSGCVPPGAETYYRSQYTGTSDSFHIELKTIESVKPAPEGSTLRILVHDEEEKEGVPAQIYFEGSQGMIEGEIGKESAINVKDIPAQNLNGLDFEATIKVDGKEEKIVFKRDREERKNFYP